MSARLDSAAAELWATGTVPRWLYRWLLPLGWVAAIAVSTISDDRRCSATDPSVCGPDRGLALALVLCLGAVLTQWSAPRLGWLLGIGFSGLELIYDDALGARVAWAVFGLACLGLLMWSELPGRRQRAANPRPQWATSRRRRVVALGLVTIGALGLGGMWWLDQREAAHLDRAVEQVGTVRGVQDDGDVELELPDGSRRRVWPYDTYQIGETLPVLVDPVDPDWARLRAQPADNTWGYTVAGTTWLMAGVVIARGRRRQMARPDPRPNDTASAPPVEPVVPVVAVAAEPVPELPWQLRLLSPYRGRRVLLIPLVVLGIGAVVVQFEPSWWRRMAVFVVSMTLLDEIMQRWWTRVVVDIDGLTARGYVLTRRVRWADVRRVGHEDDEVTVDLGRYGGSRDWSFSGHPPGRVAGVFERLRASSGPTGWSSSVRLNWGAMVVFGSLVGYWVLMAWWKSSA